MRKRVCTFLLAIAPLVCCGHIGSPNVVFEGRAGSYPVRVIIKPPGVVPGLAEISVRVQGAGPHRVTVLPVHWRAGLQGAPPPDVAKPVRGETNLYHAALWFMSRGAYSVHVNVQGSDSGMVIVPVNSIATTRLPMPRALGILLTGLAVFLFAAAITIVGAGFRESVLEPGIEPTRRQWWSSRAVIAIAGAGLFLALLGGKRWWDTVDRHYRNNRMYKPVQMAAAARLEGTQRIMRLEVADPNSEGRGWAPLVPDHGKLMHMFMVREPALDAFAHIHPVQKESRIFEVVIPPLPAGSYRLYADVTHETGFAQTLTAVVQIPDAGRIAPPGELFLAPDADDSWHIGATAQESGDRGQKSGVRLPAESRQTNDLGDGFTLVWEQKERLVENRETSLRFVVLDGEGKPARLEPYLGMFSHAALRRDDGAVFTHLHPLGTISMASQQVSEMRAQGKAPKVITAEVMEEFCKVPPPEQSREPLTFPYLFPQLGRYRIWVQVKLNGKILTGVFDTEVLAAEL